MEESKEVLDHILHCTHQEWLRNPTKDTLSDYENAKEKVVLWKQQFRNRHINWIYEKEAAGIETHRWCLTHGPRHPNSYLLYNDSGTLVFPRDHSDRYSSYAFWLQHIADEEPIDHLGKDYFSAKELNLDPSVIGLYYQQQQLFLKEGFTGQTDMDRLLALQEEIRLAFAKIDGKDGQSVA
jgi:hypothetical protein